MTAAHGLIVRLRARPADVIDVFVYVVVLNLAIEHVPAVISEGFTMSLLTAVVLKLTLEVVIWLKGHVVRGPRGTSRWSMKLTLGATLWVVAAGSKLVVLHVVDLLFGDAVSLGGFFSVTLLVVALLISRAAVRSLLDDGDASDADPLDRVWQVTSPVPPSLPAAVLWDMDGTLVDTEPYWIATEFAMAEKYGGTWSEEHALNLVGNALLESGDYIRAHMGIDRTSQQIVDELLDGVVARVEVEVPWRPGARELLTDLHGQGVPCALVTMSWQRFVDPILAQLPVGAFASVVTGDRVERGKPHPEPYLTAAAELGLDPAACLAIEDSNTGATSAVAAGCTVVCVPNHVPILEGERRVFAGTLDGLDTAGLARLASGHARGVEAANT